jgi:outer membrane protein OmpA-like peptidoglycan-associated protein
MKNFKMLAIVLFMSTIAFAQTESNPWSVGFNLNPKEYKGDIGNSYLKFDRMNLNPGLTVNRYINPFLDVNLSGNLGDYEYANDSASFNANLLDIAAKGRFKLDNGVVFKENSKFGPYLTAGLGVIVADAFNQDIENITTLNIPLGGGIRWKYNEWFNINYELTHNLNFTDAVDRIEVGDNNYSYLAHQIGMNFTLDLGKEKDTDKDGVADSKDLCPNTPKGLAVTGDGCPTIINEVNILAKNVYFETSSDVLKSESNVSLNKIAEIMKTNKTSSLSIEGHTDNTGDAVMNLDLSKRRATAVKNYLIEQGVEASRLSAQGFGEIRPVADNGTDAGRALNRRVEMVLSF